jgi:hypothetical protein
MFFINLRITPCRWSEQLESLEKLIKKNTYIPSKVFPGKTNNMKVIYLIQTHKNPEQIYRLVQIIKKSAPASYILVSHDFTTCNLDITPLQSLPGVDVIKRDARGVRGDFSLVQAYLDAVDWLFSRNIEFDWLINLSGQDYPTQPLSRIEKFLAETKYDGFLNYFDALFDVEYNIREGSDRYLYQYWHLGIQLSKLQQKLLKPLQVLVNSSQPFVKIQSFYQLSVGVRAFFNPFNQNFWCYGGSFFTILSKNCVRYLHEFSNNNPSLVSYYKKTSNPDESFIQTVLVNSQLFKLGNEHKRYIDFDNSKDCSRPRILTGEDYPLLVKDDIYFARKFDPAQDSTIFNMLDARILQTKQSAINTLD